MITIVCGAPGSGKTHFVRENFMRGDLIVDLDAIFSAISNLDWYHKPDNLLPYALEVKNALLNKVLIERDNAPRSWIITSAPRAMERIRMRSRYGAQTVVIETPADVCKRRCREDVRRIVRNNGLISWSDLIDEWWRDYEDDDGDTVIKYGEKGEVL